MKQLDHTDQKILELLQKDGRMTVKELSERLNLSTTPIFERIKKLERNGIIDHYTAVLNLEKIGKKFTAFAHISLKDHSKVKVEEFVQKITALSEVMECHYVTGGFDFIIKILVDDMDRYKEFMIERLFDIPNIGKIESFLSLEARKNTSFIQLRT